jgi:hypothetical protein
MDPDEYPPALAREGGEGASIWYVESGETGAPGRRDGRAPGAVVQRSVVPAGRAPVAEVSRPGRPELSASSGASPAAVTSRAMNPGRDDRASKRDKAAAIRDVRAIVRDALVGDAAMSEQERDARGHARADREAADTDRQAAADDRRAAATAREAAVRSGD